MLSDAETERRKRLQTKRQRNTAVTLSAASIHPHSPTNSWLCFSGSIMFSLLPIFFVNLFSFLLHFSSFLFFFFLKFRKNFNLDLVMIVGVFLRMCWNLYIDRNWRRKIFKLFHAYEMNHYIEGFWRRLMYKLFFFFLPYCIS